MGEQTAKAPGLNRAKTYQLVLFPLNNGATNVYYVLVLSYIATFGSKVLALPCSLPRSWSRGCACSTPSPTPSSAR